MQEMDLISESDISNNVSLFPLLISTCQFHLVAINSSKFIKKNCLMQYCHKYDTVSYIESSKTCLQSKSTHPYTSHIRNLITNKKKSKHKTENKMIINLCKENMIKSIGNQGGHRLNHTSFH